MNRREWALLALSTSPDGKLAPVQVQKAMFLLAENVRPRPVDGFYRFKPYHYGPFDSTVYTDLDRLIDEGLVRRIRSARYAGTEFQVTDGGMAAASHLAEAQTEVVPYLKSVVYWMRPLSFTQLVSAIYKQYPKFRAKSIFQD